jgi:hypothetical protein
MTDSDYPTRRRRVVESAAAAAPDLEDADEGGNAAVIAPRVAELEVEVARLRLENRKLRDMLRDPRLRSPQMGN